MKVSATKPTPRVERNIYLTSKKIQAYGDGNDYPQKVFEIIGSSGTGKTCFDIYTKFVRGSGFEDDAFGKHIINDDKETVNSLLNKSAKDLKRYNGFAMLVKYDFNAVPFAYYSIPFENCRLEIDSAKKHTGRIAVHPDWTGITGKTLNNNDIKYVDRFYPEDVKAQMINAGGPEFYLGQILYYTDDGDFQYPVCPFDPVVTDMLTEESVSTVKHRNAKNNFLPAGVIVRKGIKPKTLDSGQIDPNDPFNQQQEQSAHEFKKAQGDMNTSKIWVIDVDADEETPEFIDFTAKNYDRQYELTERTVQENIARMFKMPPILRGVDVGAGFGADLMLNAYDYLNSITSDERDDLERAFEGLFEIYSTTFTDYTIAPKEYTATTQAGGVE
jgi:hypothetical protein